MTRQEFDEQIQQVSSDYMVAEQDRSKKKELYLNAMYDYQAAKLKAEELYAKFDANERLRELRDLISKLTKNNQTEKKLLLTEQIKQAEQSGDESKVAELLGEYNDLIKKAEYHI